MAFFAECVANRLELGYGLGLVIGTLLLFAHPLAKTLGEQHLKVVSLSLATLAHKVVHIVPARGKLVLLGCVVEGIYYGAGLVAFQHIVFVFYVAIENLAPHIGIFFHHEIVGVACADKKVGQHEFCFIRDLKKLFFFC